jgi:plasmid stabilization system protein ParE
VSRVELAPEVTEDFDRILDHLNRHEVADTHERIDAILQSLSVLKVNPLISRPARTNMRELVIGRQSRGYVALYRYVPEIDTVFVLAIRSQREAGYRED